MILTLATLLGAGCLTQVGVDVDEDKDGLVNSEEEAAGTDPLTPDSDGDGADDGAESTAGTNPLDPDSYPYTGGWSIGASCNSTITGTGTAVGDIGTAFSLPDQFGQMVKLYDFCDRVVWVIFAAEW